MEITFGDQIKINGEEVPEYLLKALYEWYKNRTMIVGGSIATNGLNTRQIATGSINATQLAVGGCHSG